MARRKDARTVTLQFTPAQFDALERLCIITNMDKAELIRFCIAKVYTDFPTENEIIKRGRYDRRRATLGAWLSDEDVLYVDVGGVTWTAWYDDQESFEDLPDFRPHGWMLQRGDDAPTRYEFKRELLDAMEQVAPFTAWRGEIDDLNE